MKSKSVAVLGIDPGLDGAFVLLVGQKMQVWQMPVKGTRKDKNRRVDFGGVSHLLTVVKSHVTTHSFAAHYKTPLVVFCERAKPLAMGSKFAFNYGRDFAALEIALDQCGVKVHYVEPSAWAKEMHAGLSNDLKAKAKSMVMVQKAFPKLFKQLPKRPKGKTLDGPVDALLIAQYGLKALSVKPNEEDFF